MAEPTPLLMPKLGLTMTEGLVAQWVARPGQRFARGEPLAVVETEKVASEVEAPADGVLAEILVPEGEKVSVGTVLARLALDGAPLGAADAAPPSDGAPAAAATPRVSASQASGARASTASSAATASPAFAAPAPSPPASAGRPVPSAGRIVATPLARRLARERGVDLATVRGSGPQGRIKAADVTASAGARAEAHAAPPASAAAPASAPPAPGQLVEPSPFHRAMAELVSLAKREIPHFYVQSEADVRFLLEYRRKLNEAGRGPRVSVHHLVLKAVGQALVELPQANVTWHEGRLLRHAAADVGFAVATERGVVVPILRGAGTLPLGEVAARAAALTERARAARLGLDDVRGGTLAVSNVGMHDATLLTPIINPGHSAILGVGSVRELFRPGADGRPELRRELGLVLACDHRVHDGLSALALLHRIVELLENPVRLGAP